MTLINSNILNDAPTDKYFWCKDGKVIRNLKEAAQMLRVMDDDTFRHHVNNERNDFATWINDVFNDANLAGKVRDKKSKKRIARIIERRLRKTEKAMLANVLMPEKENEFTNILWFKKIFVPKEEAVDSIRFVKPFIKGLVIGITISLIIIIILSILNFLK